ncbi:MAG TPA: 3-methyl-2-oxobutanoate hydroxymethyltransferase [Candidatus Limnocylindria bacterium]|nr:3-methyl-2-oxobutanoate hydroxymethyltransferase [Candidatus Limnocylindria bacterium]
MTDLPIRQAIALPEIAAMKRAGTKIVMVTAYDHPSARLASEAGIDLLLVGDSAGNNVLGYESTVPVDMEEAVLLTAAVARARPRSLVIGDMPFGSYQASDAEAVANAVRLVKAGADAVKLEGAGPMVSRVRSIVDAGIPVMGHLGLTPQSATKLGGMKAQGRTAASARQLLADARDLQVAGAFSLVLEAVPAQIAKRVTEALTIPTIGIGAGAGCDGQVLVWHDVLGINEGVAPRFVKRYADVAGEIRRGLTAFAADVRSGAYPSEEHEYKISAEELKAFEELPPGIGDDAVFRDW